MAKKYNAFLSYNRSDKPKEVEEIAKWLKDNARLSVWLDIWYIKPGDPWQEKIEEALDESQCCVVFLGPNGIGPWQNMEMRAALDTRVSENSIRVVPVLLPGSVRPEKESQIPRFLRGLTWVAFKDKWYEPEVLRQLVFGIEDKIPDRHKFDIQEEICPYRGLEIFREQDRKFFFGRDVFVQRLLDKLSRSRFLAVIGPSGCGKSSLVQAGLIAPLRRHSQVALFSPRERPMEELAVALRMVYPEENKPPSEMLRKRLKKGGDVLHLIAREILEYWDKKNILIIIDQFEELFTQTVSEDERRLFISLILEAVDVPNGSVVVILTIRSDFIGRCAIYKKLNMFVMDHIVQVEPMGIDELRQAIEEPAYLVGLIIEDGLVNRIMNDAKGAPTELPLIEHALFELYNKRKKNELTLAAYEEIGGIDGALVKRSEAEYQKLDNHQKNILRKMFYQCLINPGEGTEDTRRIALKEEILPIDKNPEIVEQVLTQWINARFLTSTFDKVRGQVRIEVAHEALIRKWGRLKEWMAEDREKTRLLNELYKAAKIWKNENQDKAHLFRGSRLMRVEEFLNTYDIGIPEYAKEFIEASIALRIEEKEKENRALQAAHERDIAKRQAKKRAWVIAIVLLMTILSSYLAFRLYEQKKESQKQEAISYLMRSHRFKKNGRLLHSLFFLEEAISLNRDSSFESTLLLDLYLQWPSFSLANIFQYKGSINISPTSKDMKKILIFGKDDTNVKLFDATKCSILKITHNETVKGAIFSNDSSKVLTWAEDKKVQIWDANTGERLNILKHNEKVGGAAFSKHGKLLLTWTSDKLFVWNIINKAHKKPKKIVKQEGIIKGALFSPDDRKILSWSNKHTKLWNVNSNEVPKMLHDDNIDGAIFIKDGEIIITWSQSGKVTFWIGDKKKDFLLEMHVDNVIFNNNEKNFICIGPNKVAYLGNVDNVIRLKELKKLSFKEITNENKLLYGALFSPSGDQIVAFGQAETVTLWDSDGNKLKKGLFKHESWIRGAIFLDRNKILTWSDDRSVRLWDILTGKAIGPKIMHNAGIAGSKILTNDNSSIILTWCIESIVKLWKMKIEPTVNRKFGNGTEVKGAIFNEDQQKILIWTEDQKLKLLDAQNCKEIKKAVMKHDKEISGAILNKKGTKILSWSYDNTARLWDIETGKEERRFQHNAEVVGASFIEGNKEDIKILTWSKDGTARLWKNTGEKIGKDMKHNRGVVGAVYNDKRNLVLTWSADHTARLWDITSDKLIEVILSHKGKVKNAKFNADGTRILTCSYDGWARLWDTNTGREIGEGFKHEYRKVEGAVFYPDESRILTWSSKIDKTYAKTYKNKIKIWDAENNKDIHTMYMEGELVIEDVVREPSESGKRILAWSKNEVTLWNVEEGRQLIPDLKHDEGVNGATFNKAGTLILTWSRDGAARLWDATSGKQIGYDFMNQGQVVGAKFININSEAHILSWSSGGFLKIWNIQPGKFGKKLPEKDKLESELMLRTGVKLLKESEKITVIEPEEWRVIKKKNKSIQRIYK